MAGKPVPFGRSAPTEPVLHDLPPLRYGKDVVTLQLELRRADDATWRGRLLFAAPQDAEARATAEIFCAANESDLWECVYDLREHHLRDLYRSLSE